MPALHWFVPVSSTTLTPPHPQAQLAGELLNQWDANKTVAEQYPAWTRTISQTERGVAFQFGKLRSTWNIMQSGSASYRIDRTLPSRTTLDEQGLGYVSEASLTLAAKGQQDIYTLQSYVHSRADADRFEQSRQALLADPASHFGDSIRRWEDYLARGLSNQGIRNRNGASRSRRWRPSTATGAHGRCHPARRSDPPTPPAGSTGSGPGTAGSTPTPWPTSTPR